MKSRTFLLFIVLIGLYCSSCKQNEQIIEPQETSNLLLKISTQSIPESVSFLVGTLSRDGYKTIQKDFQITNSLTEVEFTEIPFGEWHFDLRAYDKNEELLYVGESDVEILPNQVNQLDVIMNPTTGTLQVGINWNTNLNQKILFYGIGHPNGTLIGTINIDGSNLKELYIGNKQYPTWYSYPNKILTIDRIINNDFSTAYKLSISIINNNTISSEIISDDIGNRIFISYSNKTNSVLYSYNDDLYRIGVYNLSTHSMTNFENLNYSVENPCFAPSGEWIYFSEKSKYYSDIYKIDITGNNLTKVIVDPNFRLTTNAIDQNEKLLVCTRYNYNESYITIYDLETCEIIYNIDMLEHSYGLYPNFTSDSKKILFVNGIPDNYTVPRNIFSMNLDGSGKKQLTFYDDMVLVRPLNW